MAVFGRENILYCQGTREGYEKNISFCPFFSFVFFLFSATPLSPFSFFKFFSPQIGACTRSKSVVSTSLIRFSDDARGEQKHSIRIADEQVALAVQAYDLVCQMWILCIDI